MEKGEIMNIVYNFMNELLRDWKNNFKIQNYDYKQYSGEVSHIAYLQEKRDENALINFWNEKVIDQLLLETMELTQINGILKNIYISN